MTNDPNLFFSLLYLSDCFSTFPSLASSTNGQCIITIPETIVTQKCFLGKVIFYFRRYLQDKRFFSELRDFLYVLSYHQMAKRFDFQRENILPSSSPYFTLPLHTKTKSA